MLWKLICMQISKVMQHIALDLPKNTFFYALRQWKKLKKAHFHYFFGKIFFLQKISQLEMWTLFGQVWWPTGHKAPVTL